LSSVNKKEYRYKNSRECKGRTYQNSVPPYNSNEENTFAELFSKAIIENDAA
jgi:hypothetical protein